MERYREEWNRMRNEKQNDQNKNVTERRGKGNNKRMRQEWSGTEWTDKELKRE